jgi:hypothetical protein
MHPLVQQQEERSEGKVCYSDYVHSCGIRSLMLRVCSEGKVHYYYYYYYFYYTTTTMVTAAVVVGLSCSEFHREQLVDVISTFTGSSFSLEE